MDEHAITPQIRSQFESRGIRRGGILFLAPRDALDMIRVCREYGVPILGIDGFVLDAVATQPDMTNSIDISLMPNADSWAIAKQFVEDRASSNLRFEVVI